jgi:hypothetical protein
MPPLFSSSLLRNSELFNNFFRSVEGMLIFSTIEITTIPLTSSTLLLNFRLLLGGPGPPIEGTADMVGILYGSKNKLSN